MTLINEKNAHRVSIFLMVRLHDSTVRETFINSGVLLSAEQLRFVSNAEIEEWSPDTRRRLLNHFDCRPLGLRSIEFYPENVGFRWHTVPNDAESWNTYITSYENYIEALDVVAGEHDA